MDRGARQATCSPWGHKESDMTGRLTLSLFTSVVILNNIHLLILKFIQQSYVVHEPEFEQVLSIVCGQASVMWCSPCGHKGSDMIELLFRFHKGNLCYIIIVINSLCLRID